MTKMSKEQVRILDKFKDKMSAPQARLLFKAYNRNMLTQDPYVNFVHDCITSLDDDHPYDERLYKEEISAWIKSGGEIL